MIKKLIVITLLVLSSVTLSQFKNQIKPEQSVGQAITNNNLFLGFINPENFKMTHSFNMQYMNFGNNSLALGIYTNSMFYKIADPLNVQLDVSLMHSPYNSFGKESNLDFNSLFISRAVLNWKPADNFFVTVQYRSIPFNSYFSPYNSPFYNSYRYNGYFYDDSGFNDWFIGR